MKSLWEYLNTSKVIITTIDTLNDDVKTNIDIKTKLLVNRSIFNSIYIEIFETSSVYSNIYSELYGN